MRFTLIIVLLIFCSWSWARADQACAPLLSNSRVLQDIAFTRLESGSKESKWSEVYLNLLGLVLEGLDEIEKHAFGHADHVQVKAQLLTSIAASQKPIDPLDVLLNLSTNESEISRNNSVRPAAPRNLTQFSPKLSTLADSGQFEVVTENLTQANWQQIRQAIKQKLSGFQTIQTAQAVATPATEHDYEDAPDSLGNTRLHRLILARNFAEALRHIESPNIGQQYINAPNKKKETAIGLVFDWLEEQPATFEHFAPQLYRALQAKGAVHDLSKYEFRIYEHVKKGNIEVLQNYYSLGVNFSTLPTFSLSLLHQAIDQKSLKTIELLIKLKAPQTKWNGFTTLNYALITDSSHQIIEALLMGSPNLEAQADNFRAYRTAFLLAVASCRKDVAKLLIERGANIYVQDEHKNNFLHLASECHGKNAEIMDLFRNTPLSHLINQVNRVFNYDKGFYEETPLHLAVRKNNVDVVKRLIELKADPYILDQDKKSAFDLAEGNETLLSELEKYKSKVKRKQ